ncbi:MAG: hypothetical protein JWO51_4065 [Rhodospirillales bacterium]|nr:hypothetical protein [Rhodospirillales bacterium]
MSKNPTSVFLPSTFEERGAIAPFTTPSLAMSRVRPDDRHGLVLMMPNMGGGDGAYVVPWGAVTDVVSMSVHDRALHETVLEDHAVTPDAMRIASLKVAKTGLAGPRAAHAAKKQLQEEEEQYVETNFLLVVALLSSLGMSSRELFTLQPDSDAWRNLVRGMLHSGGEQLGIDLATVYERLGKMARILTPIGLKASRQEGRLRLLMNKLVKFRDDLKAWGEQDVSDAAPYAEFASEVADFTVRIAGRTFESLDDSMRDIPTVIGQWGDQVKVAQAAAARISWLLDGWDYILAIWARVADAHAIEKREAVSQLKLVLPIIPRDEMDADEEARKRRQSLTGTKRMKAMVNWRTGELDDELAGRIAEMKIKAAEVASGLHKGPVKDATLAADIAAEIDQLEMLSRHESVRLKLIEGAGQMSINYDLEAITRQEALKATAGELLSLPVRAQAQAQATA